MSQTVHLGPGPIADPYRIPADDWAIVNKRVSVVVQSGLREAWPIAFYQKLKALPNYRQLLAVAQTWNSSTFEGLVSFASSLETFGAQTVQGCLDKLGPLVDKLTQGDTSVKPRFDQTVDGLTRALAPLGSQASALVQPLKAFDLQMTQADVSGSGAPDPIWSVFSKSAGTAFDVIEGRFEILADDLNGLKSAVEQQLHNDLPVVIQLVDLPEVRRQWQEVGRLASTFVAGASQQRQYLASDAWQYADPAIQESSLRYRIKNRQSGEGKCLDCNNMADQGNFSGQNWQFVRLGGGFYRLLNEYQPNKALDTFGGSSHQAFMGNLDVDYVGQYWRFVPVGGGWYRMSNLFLSEEFSLQVHPDGSLWMEKTADSPSQYFKIVPW
jgi:hypothetical protein